MNQMNSIEDNFNCSYSGLSSVMSYTLDIDRIIEMAWEDRTPFDAIEHQFNIKENQVRKRCVKWSFFVLHEHFWC